VTFKKAVGKIHLWLGLASGLVVFIVALTGCIYTFQKEISERLHPDLYFVPPPDDHEKLPLSFLQHEAQAMLGKDKPINFIVAYNDPVRAWEFSAYKEGPEDALTYFDALEYYKVVRVNPYTGKITGTTDYKYEFFNVVKYLHWSLLLSTKYGQPIVGIGTLIFVILLITGLILWWPKKWNKANFNKSFKIKWKAKFKRLNYDLHNVPGFYSLFFVLLLSLSGMVWAFRWFQSAVYVVSSLSVTPPKEEVFKSGISHEIDAAHAIDVAFTTAASLSPGAKRIGISPAYGPDAAITIYAYKGREIYYDYDELSFDQHSGRLLGRQDWSKKNNGEKIIGMNYDIHVGAALGLPGKIVAFIASFIAASLPVTGFLIWWGRRNKKAIH
jgi:uncharacterized iron-regulated membrane protein